MCGICGFAGPPDRRRLEAMTARLRHRGPDEDGFHHGAGISLGMRRLSIIDPATGGQPVRNEDGSVIVVMNGEIYNFQALREELARKGHTFCSDHSDTEVIAHLYEEHGDDFAHRLNGMFAIALWDDTRQRLLLVRDRFGVKPLFWAAAGGELAFASEIKSLLLHPDVSREPDLEGLRHYFSLKHVPAPHTAFRDIRALRPGHVLAWSAGGCVERPWWALTFNERQDMDPDEACLAIRDILADATRLRMISDVPIGAYLSGGVDSSTIVSLMSRSGPVKTFCLGYEDDFANKQADLRFSRLVSAHLGTEQFEHIMTRDELVEDLPRVVEAMDQPFSGTISTYFLTKLISRHVKVALSGDGADELFGSYLSHRTALPMAHYSLHRERILSLGPTPEDLEAMAPCDASWLERLFQASGGGEARWRHRQTVFTDQDKRGLLSPDFDHAHWSTLGLLEREFAACTSSDPLNRVLEMEWRTIFPDQVLAFMDFLSMAHSVELRSPFLDYRLAELAATIPGRLKIRAGNVKDILKRAVEPLLPPGVTKRPKEGFVLPVFQWLGHGLEGWRRDVLSPARIARSGLLDAGAVADLTDRYDAGQDHLAAKVWNVLMFQLWWEQYLG